MNILNKMHSYSFHISEISYQEGSFGEPGKRSRRSFYSKSYIVEIKYATKIPLNTVLLSLNGAESQKVQDALRVLDIILRQQAAKRYSEDQNLPLLRCLHFDMMHCLLL